MNALTTTYVILFSQFSVICISISSSITKLVTFSECSQYVLQEFIESTHHLPPALSGLKVSEVPQSFSLSALFLGNFGHFQKMPKTEVNPIKSSELRKMLRNKKSKMHIWSSQSLSILILTRVPTHLKNFNNWRKHLILSVILQDLTWMPLTIVWRYLFHLSKMVTLIYIFMKDFDIDHRGNMIWPDEYVNWKDSLGETKKRRKIVW